MRIPVCFLIVFSLLCSCGGGDCDALFGEIDSLASVNPELAMARLDSIDPSAFSDRDRNRYDLLRIKANDKAYVVHTSDSLILSVVDYYSDHGSDARYAEALYYAGRVYSDLGDAPAALRYFQQALELLPDNGENHKFHGTILSQTGRLLESLRLWEQAKSYLWESFGKSIEFGDTLNAAYDLELLGSIYLSTDSLDKAGKILKKAIMLVSTVSKVDSANISVLLAEVYSKKGDVDSALNIIRPLPGLVEPLFRNIALKSAAEIYHSAGIRDTAYSYARQLAFSDGFDNKKTGFRVMLSPEIIGFVPRDSVAAYILEYNALIEAYHDTYDKQGALIQNASYNYQIHVRERERAEASRLKIERVLFSIVVVVLIILIVSFYVRYRDSKEILRLRKALDVLESLQTGEEPETAASAPVYDADSLRGRLLAKVRSLEEEESEIAVPDLILQSKPYNEILKKLDSDSKKLVSPETWDGLAAVVEEAVPGFKERLDELTDGKLSETNYQMVLLIKCGFSPTAISTLLVKAKGTISSNRRYLGKRIFGQTITGQLFDKIIRLL